MTAPQTGLTSCPIGDIGYPRTVHGNPRHKPYIYVHVYIFVTESEYSGITLIWIPLGQTHIFDSLKSPKPCLERGSQIQQSTEITFSTRRQRDMYMTLITP